jgi:hypothetical protein
MSLLARLLLLSLIILTSTANAHAQSPREERAKPNVHKSAESIVASVVSNK